jgi:RNA polymerase II subunit A C-terminal domain phosphatase SSU72
VCVVCASNQNRSMEAHHVLLKKGFTVTSYGTNTMIKLPGATPTTPNSYPFGTSYESIAKDLSAKDVNLYRQNGMLMLLERNKHLKNGPERFQDRREIEDDIIITCEERCFDIVGEDLLQRGGGKINGRAVHLVNFDIIDSPEEATLGARSILQFMQSVQKEISHGTQMDDAVPHVYEDFLGQSNLKTLYSVHFID